MLESLVGLIEPATRHAAVSTGGVGPGGSNVPAGTVAAMLMVVSVRASVARLSHETGAADEVAEAIEALANIANARIVIASNVMVVSSVGNSEFSLRLSTGEVKRFAEDLLSRIGQSRPASTVTISSWRNLSATFRVRARHPRIDSAISRIA
jgi:hypothetical protein